MLTEKRIDEALEVTPLAQLDSRLDQPGPAGIVPISSRNKAAKIGGKGHSSSMHIQNVPPVHSQLVREAAPAPQVPQAAPAAPQAAPAPPEKQGAQGEVSPEEIKPEDLPQQPGLEEPPTGMPSGSGYSIDIAKGQLDGILKHWMDLAGNFPEGKKRHEFLEVGERLREISAVINRDFLGGAEGGGEEDIPPAPPPAPPAAAAPEAVPEAPPAPEGGQSAQAQPEAY